MARMQGENTKLSFKNHGFLQACHSRIEPYYLIEHERGNNGKQGDKEHRADLCGRCKSGRPCRGARFQARRESTDEESSEEEYSDEYYSSSDEESVTDLMYGMNLNQYESSEEEQYYDPYDNYYDGY